MAPFTQSTSLPVSLSDRISRLKVFSGAASKDEVSERSSIDPPDDGSRSRIGAFNKLRRTDNPELTDQASTLIQTALERGRSDVPDKRTGGALAALGMRAAGVTTGTPSEGLLKPSQPVGAPRERRSSSPFFRARKSREEARRRDSSPEVGPLPKDAESETESVGGKFRPQVSAYEDDSEAEDSDDEALPDGEDEEIMFDEETEKNTEANAYYAENDAPPEDAVFDRFGEETEQDPLGEGPNVVIPPEPLFQTGSVKKLKSGLDLEISRPIYARDRCTITLTHGDPDAALEKSGKRLRRYVVLSDLSEESQYAVEWAVGTVARDGDELFVISVKEDESKVDPKDRSSGDRAQKLKVQKERQTTCLLLSRQVTSLLQRTQLSITVTCQFLHAKNARHMLLDLIDFLEPTMVIVGSRGLGKLKGILLGSTSHYLVQKSSVPVMVARRRLRRPLRRTDPAALRHSPRVSLASASIEKTASSKQEDEVVDLAETEGEPGGPAKAQE